MNEQTEPGDANNASETVAVLANMLWRSNFETVLLGDIFLERDRATFIPYGGFRCTTPIVTGAAAVFGGLVGVVANQLLDGAVGDVLPKAKKARTVDWGLSPSERAQAHAQSIQVARFAIESIETSGGLAVAAAGEEHMFGHAFPEDAAEHSRLFKEWHAGDLRSHASATEAGLGIEYPPPQVLLDSFFERRPVISGHALERAAGDKEYMQHVMKLFATMGPWTQERLLKSWEDEPRAFRVEIAAFLREESRGADRWPYLTIGLLLIACAGAAYAGWRMSWLLGGKHGFAKGSFAASGLAEIAAILACLYAGAFAVNRIIRWRTKRRHQCHFIAFGGDKLVEVGDAPRMPLRGDKMRVPNRVVLGQVWAGALTGIVFGGGGGLLLSLIPASVPGADERCATMGFWAFIGAYLSSAILSAVANTPKTWQRGKSIATIVAVGVALCATGYACLNSMSLYDESDVGMIALPLAMGAILGGVLYAWMHNSLPFLFPLLSEAKKVADDERQRQLKSG